MPFSLRKLTRLHFIALSVVTLVGCLTVALTGRNPATKGNQLIPTLNVSIEQDNPKVKFEAELLTILPQGFEPKEIKRPKGAFLLAVDNRSGVHNIAFSLSRDVGGKLHDVTLPKGQLLWRQFVDLPPGKYILSEAMHPEWVCSLTISAK